ncbi:hypothetical protein ACLOJK_001708 [Asimina triloba]
MMLNQEIMLGCQERIARKSTAFVVELRTLITIVAANVTNKVHKAKDFVVGLEADLNCFAQLQSQPTAAERTSFMERFQYSMERSRNPVREERTEKKLAMYRSELVEKQQIEPLQGARKNPNPWTDDENRCERQIGEPSCRRREPGLLKSRSETGSFSLASVRTGSRVR